jgi:hypothetical protein
VPKDYLQERRYAVDVLDLRSVKSVGQQCSQAQGGRQRMWLQVPHQRGSDETVTERNALDVNESSTQTVERDLLVMIEEKEPIPNEEGAFSWYRNE